MPEAATVRVRFEPSGREAAAPRGAAIAEALALAGITLPLDCGGNGTCGRCAVLASGGLAPPDDAEAALAAEGEPDPRRRLACRAILTGDATVWLPPTADHDRQGWPLEPEPPEPPEPGPPVIEALPCSPPPPTLEDHRSDLGRILASLPRLSGEPPWRADHRVAGQAGGLARAAGWDLAAYGRGREVVGLSRRGLPPLGAAVDLGSTKLAVYLMDLSDGRLLAARGRLNPQVAHGADVITRLHRAVTSPEDARRMTRLVREAVAALILAVAAEAGAEPSRVSEVCLVGNTAMTHLLLGLPVAQLAAAPFVAALDGPVEVKARELGLAVAPGAYVHIPPQIGGFVGADNVAMILGCDLDRGEAPRLGLDIGTNTEIVLSLPGADKPLLAASAPSGPTFEGAHLGSGMRAMDGAISKVWPEGGRVAHQVIGGGPAMGVCGSGVIDVLAALRRLGLLDERGRLDPSDPRLTGRGARRRLVLASARESGAGVEVAVSQGDVSQVQLAKAAIMAGIGTLLQAAGLAEGALGEVILAGSFGSGFDAANARLIGLLPAAPGAECRQVGNAAGRGARRMLVGLAQRRRGGGIPARTRYVELSSMPAFKTLFARNLAFPPLPPVGG